MYNSLIKLVNTNYSIAQEKNKPSENFKQMNTIIQHIKSGIQTIQIDVMNICKK
jgi:hypothetical protein